MFPCIVSGSGSLWHQLQRWCLISLRTQGHRFLSRKEHIASSQPSHLPFNLASKTELEYYHLRFSKPPGEMPVVWAVTLGSNHRACGVKPNLQMPAHRLLQHNVPTVAPRTSSLPQMQIQISPTDSSSWKSLYIPTLTLCRQEQFQSCLSRWIVNQLRVWQWT